MLQILYLLKQICNLKIYLSSNITNFILTYYFPALHTRNLWFYIYSDSTIVYIFIEY